MEQEILWIEIDSCDVQLGRRTLSQMDVLALAGRGEGGTVIRVDERRGERFEADVPYLFASGARLAFRTFEPCGLHHVVVNGQSWEWGAPTITARDVTTILQVRPNAVVMLQGRAAALGSDELIDLRAPSTPCLHVQEQSGAGRPVHGGRPL